MDINKMTLKVQNIIERAQQEAVELKLQSIELETVLKAMLTADESMASDILTRANVNTEEIIEEYDRKLKTYNAVTGDSIEYGVYMSNGFSRLYNNAEKKMAEMEDTFISQEHILLAALEEDSILKEAVGNKEIIKEIVKKIRGGNHVTSQNPENQYEALEKYGRDLVEEVRKGNMDPVIGRDEEIRDTIRILSRKRKITRY